MKQMLLFWVCICMCLVVCAQDAAISHPPRNLERSLPDLFRFKVPESTLIKIDVLNTFRRLNGDEAFGLINLGLEQKISPSFSLDSRLAAAYYLSFSGKNPHIPSWDGTIGLDIAPRYYYNLRKRMRNSQSASNVSANYLSVVGSTQLMFRRTDPRFVEPLGNYYFRGLSISPVYGIQRRIGKWMYVDVQAGFRFFNTKNDLSTPGLIISTPHLESWKVSPFSTIRLGVAF